MFERLAAILLRFRWAFIALAVVVTAIMASPLIPPDEIRFDFSFRRLFRFDGPEAAELTRFRTLFGDDAGTAGVLYVCRTPSSRACVLSPELVSVLRDMETWLAGRSELEPTFLLSPFSATDFFSDPLEKGALGNALAAADAAVGGALDDAEHYRSVDEAWRSGAPLPDAYTRYFEVAQRLLGHRIYQGMVLSADGRVAALSYRFNTAHMHPSARREFLAALDGRVALDSKRLDGRYELHQFGIPVVSEEYTRLSIQDVARTAPLSVAIMALFLLILFRSLTAMVLPQVVVLCAVVWSIGMMQMTDEPFNMISHIVPVMVLVVGVADAVHVMSRYNEEIARGLAPPDAIRITIGRLSRACFLTSSTTAVGFASLATATIATIASFGIYTGIAVMFTYVVNMTLLPIALSFLRPRLRPQKARDGLGDRLLDGITRLATLHARGIFYAAMFFCVGGAAYVALNIKADNHLLEEVPPENRVYRATSTMEQMLSPVIPYEVLIRGKRYSQTCEKDEDCLEAGPSGTATCVLSDRVRRALSPARDAFGLLLPGSELTAVDGLEQAIAGGQPVGQGRCVETVKDARLLAALDKVTTELMAAPLGAAHVGRVEGLHETVKQMHQAFRRNAPGSYSLPDSRQGVAQLLLPLESSGQEFLDRVVTLDYDATRVTLYLYDHGSSAWEQVKGELQQRLQSAITLDPDLGRRYSFQITGTMNFVEKALSFIVSDMMTSLGTAFIFIFGLIVLLFRSVRVGMVSFLPNIFPVVATLVMMVLFGIELRTATVLIFSISLGIAVNDTIHFIARYNEEIKAGREPQEAIRLAMRSTGRAMVVTTVILAGGFLVDLISEFVALRQFGYLASFTLVMALLGDMFVLPASLKLMAKPSMLSLKRPSSEGSGSA